MNFDWQKARRAYVRFFSYMLAVPLAFVALLSGTAWYAHGVESAVPRDPVGMLVTIGVMIAVIAVISIIAAIASATDSAA
jgi:hypothetical protein